MQYNFHNEKYKQSDIGGIHKEQFREYQNNEQYKNEVHSEMSDRNSYIALSENGTEWFRRVRQAKEISSETTGRIVRKDAVVLCSTVESVPASWDAKICNEYFQAKAKWYNSYLQEQGRVDEGNMLSVCIHLDETTPHATYVWIPIRDGKLQAKNILNKSFLRALQIDSQDFTMTWIDEWNRIHPGQFLEELEPIVSGSKKKHLDEQEYKAGKIAARIQQLEKENHDLAEMVTVRKNDLTEIESSIGNLREERKELDSEKKTIASEKINIQKQLEEVEKVRKAYAEKLILLTKAPDLNSYENICHENDALKQELSHKNDLIEKLQESLEKWKEAAETWKKKFMQITRRAGLRMMELFGFDLRNENEISEYPDSHVSAGIERLHKEANRIDPGKLKIVTDSRDDELYMIVYPDGPDERVFKRGFASKEEALQWKKNYSNMAKKMRQDKSQVR